MTTIYVASTSLEKVKATENGWKAIYPNNPATVVPLTNANDAPSLVGEQPLNDDILIGAWNRLNALKKLHHDSLRDGDYLVAFESGIWVDKTETGEAQSHSLELCSNEMGQSLRLRQSGTEYVDYGEEGTACVIMKVQHSDHPVACAKSECRRYPYHVVTQALKEGVTSFKEHNKRVSDWFKKNPSNTGLTREQVMTNVCAVTLAKL